MALEPSTRPEGGAFLANVWRLSAGDKLLAAEAAVCLACARFLILFVPLRRWNHTAGIGRGEAQIQADRNALDRAVRIGRVVRLTARRMPFRAVCLPQAVAVQWMLRRRGLRGVIHLGARKPSPDDTIKLHAWLTFGGVVLTGAREAPAFTPLRRREAQAALGPDHERRA